MKDKNKKGKNILWILIGIGVFIFIVLIIVSNALDVGEKLGAKNKYLEYGFYALSAILFYALIIRPIGIIIFAPDYELIVNEGENSIKNIKMYKRAVKSIIKHNDLEAEDIEKLRGSLKDKNALKENLSSLYDNLIKKEINKCILKNAAVSFTTTAVSQNNNLDTLSSLIINIKMIKEIVQKAGFRPSFIKIGKLSVRVLATSLVSYGLDDLNVASLFPKLDKIPIAGTLINSTADGLGNALMTLRIGFVTKNYIFSDGKQKAKAEVNKEATKEASKVWPNLLKEIFKKKDKAPVETKEVAE